MEWKRWRKVIGATAVMTLGLCGSLVTEQAMAQGAHHGRLNLTKTYFGTAVEPSTGRATPVFRYVLANNNGMSVAILTYGGIIQEINVADRHGKTADVVLGFKTLDEYVGEDSPPVTANTGPYFGEVIGRYANRIAGSMFQLKQPDGKLHTYTLQQNSAVNSLHGGLVGFGSHIWSDQPVKTDDTVGVQLTLDSPDGDGAGAVGSPGCPGGCTGFPASLHVVVTYTLDDDGNLKIRYSATDTSTNLNTVLNLTNHSYFNLAGEDSGSAENQLIKINADRFTPVDANSIPSGALAPVAGTPLDFTHERTIGSAIDDCTGGPNSLGCRQLLNVHGLAHNWVLNDTGPKLGGLDFAATAEDPASGRRMTVWTDQPGLQMYAGNSLNGTLIGISGHTYRQTQAYTFETQHFPDSPNEPGFPSTELDAGKTFTSTTVYSFSS